MRALNCSRKYPYCFSDFPQPEDGGVLAPIEEVAAGDGPHARPAATAKRKIGLQLPERGHHGSAMCVAARLARDEIERLHGDVRVSRCLPLASFP